jgi:predicted Zn-dependent peptidase
MTLFPYWLLDLYRNITMYKKVFLENNIPVVMERTEDTRSVCIGIWVKVGSRNESPEENGISHFLEHMFFKGTKRRDAKTIAMEIDSIGGELNAFTSSETTTFYIKVIDEYIDRGINLLTDIFLNSTFPESDILKEKQIIAEEIKMIEDTPSDYIHELFSRNIWGERGLGLPVVGSLETIKGFTREGILKHIDDYYRPDNIIIACSGNLNEDLMIERMNKTIGRVQNGQILDTFLPSRFNGGLNIATKRLSEAHICLGLEGIPFKSAQRYAMHLLNTILGSGYSSRLFQKIREERGLAYSIYSYHQSFFDTGLWAVYAGTDERNLTEVIDIVISELKRLQDTITEGELQRAKGQLKGNLMLALESTSSKMTNLARQEIYLGKHFSPQEIIKAVEDITLDEVRALAGELVNNSPLALTIYGPVMDRDMEYLEGLF